MKIAFIGVGVMGRPMAAHLQAAGHQLFLVRRRSELPRDLLDGGAVACPTARDAAAAADLVILMLPDTPDVEQALFGADGVAEGLRSGATVIDMSSIDPIATRAYAARLSARGCDYLDAPVSGGEVGARNAALTIMCGGNPAVFQRLLSVLQLMGRSVTLVGPVGDGQVAKVANQIIVAVTIEAVAEALVFAARAGADPAKVRQALMGGFAASRVLEAHGERMIRRTFDPGFRIALHQKDLGLALDTARRLSMALPATAAVQQLFGACAARGGGAMDHSGLVRAVELLADFEIAGPAPRHGVQARGGQ